MSSNQIARNYILYPVYEADSKATYYIDTNSIVLNEEGLVTLISKRIGPDVTSYTLIKIDCINKKYIELGYSEESEQEISLYEGKQPTYWSELMDGSSKFHLVQYVCNNLSNLKPQ